MWFKICSLILVISCTKIDNINPKIDLTIEMQGLQNKKTFSFIKNELAFLFQTSHPQNTCNIQIAVKKWISVSGITSSAFAVNQIFNLSANYTFVCKDGLKTKGNAMAETEITVVPERTLSQYVGLKHTEKEASRKIAKEIYEDIKIFLILSKKT